VTLALHAFGPLDAPPLVLVHGFTQTGRCWGPVGEALARRHRIVAVDAPGHGDAGSDGLRCTVEQAAAELVATGGPATYLGYSMGGRICLRAAVDRPHLVRRLVLVSATAGLAGADERAERRAADERLADRLEAIGVDRFLDEWLALPLFAGLAVERASLPERRRNDAAGLAASLRLAGTGCQEPLWDRLSSLSMPVLVVAGQADQKFVALAERLAGAIPGADLAVIAGVGHTAHLEAPEAFLEVLVPWLDATAPVVGRGPAAA
jgi:2-succinyl-6-hydroxy-2,4-cyclohexadiene-1-carboxylate synthase